MQQAFKYYKEERSNILNYIRGRGVPYQLTGDLLAAAMLDVVTYYNPDRAKSVHLAVGRQLNKYFAGYGDVVPEFAESLSEDYKDGVEGIIDLPTSVKDLVRDPLELAEIAELRENYPDIINNFTRSKARRDYLTLVIIEGVEPPIAYRLVGLTRAAGSLIHKQFIAHLGG